MTDLHVEALGPHDAEISLLLMHGPGLDHTYFRPYMDSLADEYRLVFYDHRQNGRSPRDPTRVVDLEVMASDAADVVRSAAVGRTIVVAHSWGPWVALRAAARPNSFVSGLVLVSPGLSPHVGPALMKHVAAHGTAKVQGLLATVFSGQVNDDAALAHAYRAVLPLYFASSGTELAGRLIDRAIVSSLGFNQFLSACMGTFDGEAALASLRVPCLVVAGAGDWLESSEETSGGAVARKCPLAALEVIPEAGHFPFIEQPEAFARALRRWLTSQFSRLA